MRTRTGGCRNLSGDEWFTAVAAITSTILFSAQMSADETPQSQSPRRTLNREGRRSSQRRATRPSDEEQGATDGEDGDPTGRRPKSQPARQERAATSKHPAGRQPQAPTTATTARTQQTPPKATARNTATTRQPPRATTANTGYRRSATTDGLGGLPALPRRSTDCEGAPCASPEGSRV